MTLQEKHQSLSDLQQSKLALRKALEDISPERFVSKPSPDRWSISEIVEHLMKVESSILSSIKRMIAREMTNETEEKRTYEEIMAEARDPEVKAQAPGRLVPVGSFSKIDTALQAFEQVREETESFVQTNTYDLDSFSFPHPRLGVLTGMNWLAFIAGHCWRHVRQVERLKA